MLSTYIDDINEMVGVVPECEPYRKSWQRIKTALAELGTTPNKQSPPLVCDGCGNEMDECNKVNICHDCYSMIAD